MEASRAGVDEGSPIPSLEGRIAITLLVHQIGVLGKIFWREVFKIRHRCRNCSQNLQKIDYQKCVFVSIFRKIRLRRDTFDIAFYLSEIKKRIYFSNTTGNKME